MGGNERGTLGGEGRGGERLRQGERVLYLKQYLSACRQGDHDGYLVIIKLVPAMSLVVDNQKWKQLMAGKTEVRRQYTYIRTYSMYIRTYIHTSERIM